MLLMRGFGRFSLLRASTAAISGSQRRLAGGASLAALVARQQAPKVAARSLRRFSAASETKDVPHEALKRDFGRWLRGELSLLAGMLLLGVGGVYFYQNRESAPWKRVARLVAQAETSAEQGDRQQALKLTLQAYDVVKSTSRHDRHLFEMAFAIAAQYETLGRGGPATKYYLDALDHLTQMGESEGGARTVKRRIVTLDRIAQCYEDRGQKKAAERYFKQAVAEFDQLNGQRAISSAPRRASANNQAGSGEASERRQVDREIPGVLYNYGRFLLSERRLAEAKTVLRRAFRLANAAALEDEDIALIDEQLEVVSALTMAAPTKDSTGADGEISR